VLDHEGVSDAGFLLKLVAQLFAAVALHVQNPFHLVDVVVPEDVLVQPVVLQEDQDLAVGLAVFG